MQRYTRHHTEAYLVTNPILRILKNHAPEHHENLINNGSSWLDCNSTHYKDDNIIFVANDVTARFNITFLNDSKEAYLKAISLLNNVLALGFPLDFGIHVKGLTSKTETVVLQDQRTINYDASVLFINASLHPETHEAIRKYISLNQKSGKYQWEEPNGQPHLEIGAIELHALIAQDLKHFDLAFDLHMNITTNNSELYVGLVDTIFKNHGINTLTVAMYDNIAARLEDEIVFTEEDEVVIRSPHYDMGYFDFDDEIEEEIKGFRTYNNSDPHKTIIITDYLIQLAM